jgi:ankyrin repeat protein
MMVDVAASLIQELLERAVGRLCPEQAALCVRRSVPLRRSQRGLQHVSQLPITLWHEQRVAGQHPGWVSPAQLGEALRSELLPSVELRRLVRCISVACDGKLLFLTGPHGALACPLCGDAWPGKRALRNHLQTGAHGVTTAQSVRLVSEAEAACCSAPVTASEPRTLPPACAAARDGAEAMLRRLLEEDESALEAQDAHGCRPLHWAAGSGGVACTQLLLAHGAAVEPPCAKGRTPLHWAARHGQLECIELLVAAGAQPARRTLDGTTALHLAAWRGHIHVCNWLTAADASGWRIPNAFGCDAGHWAAMGGDDALPVLHMLDAQAAGWDWAKPNGGGHTPLHKAAARNAAAVVSWLLARMAPGEMEALDAEGLSALELAALWGSCAAAEALLHAGAQPRAAAAVARAMGHVGVADLVGRLSAVGPTAGDD